MASCSYTFLCSLCFSFFQSCILASLLSEEPTKVNKVVDLMLHKDEAKQIFNADVSTLNS